MHSAAAPKTTVIINGVVNPLARVLTVDQMAGGRRLDSATFEYMLPGTQKAKSEFQDLDFSSFTQGEVSILVQPPGAAAFPVHWGKISGYSIRHDSSGEFVVLNSRQELHHFGDPIQNIPIWLRSGGILRVQKPLIFNEEIDGQIFANKCSKLHAGFMPHFIDPDSVRTLNAMSYQRAFAQLWNLQEAVDFLCSWLNPFQTYIRNPILAELAKLPTDNKLIRNHEIKYGLHLPLALDAILEPYGFGWYVRLVGTERRIQFFRRGAGFVRTFEMQKPGEQIDLTKTNVEAVNIGLDVTSRAYNSVRVIGDFEHYESTFELMPAWEAALDASTDDDLAKDAESWKTNPKLSRVWRDWVLNEAGDYQRSGYPRAKDLNSIFGKDNWYPNRRKFLPCITLGDDGAPIGQTGGIMVEWYDGTDSTWKPLDEIGPEARHVRILERECGIRFDGAVPPYELMSQGIVFGSSQGLASGARIRVTATIVSDKRVSRARAEPASLIADEKELVLEVPSRFKHREVLSTSNNYSGVKAKTFKTTEVNDFTLAGILVDELLENWNQSSIDGNVTLTSHLFDVQQALGDPLGGIFGRNIKFGTNVAGTKFPTVVGISLNFQDQKTTVTLDTWQKEISSY